jgi:hypothetical protein
MGIADNSQTERIRVLKSRTLAVARRNALLAAQTSGYYAPEFGPGGQTFPQSVRQMRAFGQRAYVRMNAAGTNTTTLEPCCLPTEEQAPPS